MEGDLNNTLTELFTIIRTLNSKVDSLIVRFENVEQANLHFKSEIESMRALVNKFTVLEESHKTASSSSNNGSIAKRTLIYDHPSVKEVSKATSPVPATVASFVEPLPASSSVSKTAEASTWAHVTRRKSKAPLTQRKIMATARAFSPPVSTDTPSGYAHVYIPRSRRLDRREVRQRFSRLGVDSSRIIDVTLPARGVVGLLVHKEYLPEFLAVLGKCKIVPLDSFDPLLPAHIADPQFNELSVNQRAALAKSINQDRCIRTLQYVREYLVPGVARYFVQLGWVSAEIADSVVRARIPRPQKRVRSDHYVSAASAFFGTLDKSSQDTPMLEAGEEFHNNAYGSDEDSVSDFEVDPLAPPAGKQ